MTRDEFLAMTEEDQNSYLAAADANAQLVPDLTAERDSFKTENDKLKASAAETAKELKQVKETNYTLARKLSVEDTDTDPEEALYNLFK